MLTAKKLSFIIRSGEIMIHQREAFIKILMIELEDLEEDIELLIQECDERHCKNEISEYVFLENLATLKNEMFGVESFLADIMKIDPLSYKNVNDLVEELKEKLKKRIKEKGLAKSVEILINRKMLKVLNYVNSSEMNSKEINIKTDDVKAE